MSKRTVHTENCLQSLAQHIAVCMSTYESQSELDNGSVCVLNCSLWKISLKLSGVTNILYLLFLKTLSFRFMHPSRTFISFLSVSVKK